jgi:CheY-like chemotaxis protein/DNA-binding XRE family transcriptional regulator
VAKKEKVPRNGPALQIRLAAAVKSSRQKLGITQEELAWRASMHRTYLADIERGVRNITLRSIENLAHALQLSIEGLLSGASAPGSVSAPETSNEVLLVEDNPEDIELTLRAFRRAKFSNKLTVARDGAEALAYLFRTGQHAKRTGGQPQLVLLDLGLPKVSGLEVLRQLRAHKATKDIPVVVLTVSGEDATILECSRLGTINYIVKPIDFGSFAHATSKLHFNWTLSAPETAADSR